MIRPPRPPAAKPATRDNAGVVPAVVIYSRAGHTALALHPNPQDGGLAALRVRLQAKGYAVVSHVPRASLTTWAAVDTPPRALEPALAILAAREATP